MGKIALLGYSGHAYVVAEAIIRSGNEILGYFDRKELRRNPLRLRYLGYERNTEHLETIKNSECNFFVCIGDNLIRKNITKYLAERECPQISVIDPTSIVSNMAKIGFGSFIAAGAIVNPVSQIGNGAIINSGAIIEHECDIGDFAHVAPGAVLAGNVSIGEGSFIGANAVIKQGVKVGKNVVIGAGSVVLLDLSDNLVYAGNPARELKKRSQ